MIFKKSDITSRPSVSKKWEEVKQMMETHIVGVVPEWLFINRRPLESTSEYALKYRKDNFQPITKQSFNLAVGAIIETVNHISVNVEDVDDNTADYLYGFKIKCGNKSYSLKEYIFNHVALHSEIDPNAVLVLLPKHPTDQFIPDYREDLPNFDSITNQSIDIDVRLIGSEDIHAIDSDKVVFYGGQWLYAIKDKKEKFEPFYYVLTKDETSLLVPRQDSDNQIVYDLVPFYSNGLKRNPFHVMGYNSVAYVHDGEYIDYKESTYSGAAAIGNEVLAVKSDEQICTTRFTYPEKFATVDNCGHPGAVLMEDDKSPYFGMHVVYDAENNCSACPSCNGAGYVKPDTSPLGTHFVPKSKGFDQEGKFVPPLQFITPPLESPKYLDDKWRKDFEVMERALCIVHQNMTNQSGESKSYDIRQRVTIITKAVRNILSLYEMSLNAVQGYLRGEEEVMVLEPVDFNIKTSDDLTIELSESSATSSVYASTLTKDLILKKIGGSDVSRKIVDFLELVDLFFGMNSEDVLKASISYPQANRAKMQAIHDKGLAILLILSREDGFIDLSFEDLMIRFDTEIDRLIGSVSLTTSQESPIA